MAALAWMLPGVGVIDPRTFEIPTSFGTFFYAAGWLCRAGVIDASGWLVRRESKRLPGCR